MSGNHGVLYTTGWLFRAALLKTLWTAVRRMDVDRASATGYRLLSRLGPRTNKHRHVLANLGLVFPEKSRAEIERIGIEVWGNCGAVIAEFAVLDRLVRPGNGDPRIEIIRADTDGPDTAGQQPCIYVGAHLANWELMAFAAGQVSGTLDVVYNAQPYAPFDRLVQRRRAALGCGFVGKQQAVRALVRTLKQGGSVGLLADLRLDGGKQLPFFGVETTVTTTPAWLALKTGARIVPIRTERLGGAHFRITLYRSLCTDPVGGETREQTIDRVTAGINAHLESWIRARPGEWLCTQRRWPKDVMKQRGLYS